jgi:hypothetical protein
MQDSTNERWVKHNPNNEAWESLTCYPGNRMQDSTNEKWVKQYPTNEGWESLTCYPGNRMQDSTNEGGEPRLVASVLISQPITSSIRCEARINRTEGTKLNFLILFSFMQMLWDFVLYILYISLKGILTEKCKVGGRVADELYERLSHHLRYPRET